jgi:16S rRNA (cytosine967-C5)-methyltransferase
MKPAANIDPVRDRAVELLLRVFHKDAYLSIALDKSLEKHPLSSRGSRFLAQLVYGTTRHRLFCDFVVKKLVDQPLDLLPAPIRVILNMGVYQILFLSTTPLPAVVNTSVDLAQKWGHTGTARLVNAVLRRVPPRMDLVRLPNFERMPEWHLSLKYSIPEWLVRAWFEELGPEKTVEVCRALSEEAPITVRTNTLRLSRDELVDMLQKAESVVRLPEYPPEAILLESGLPPARSKAFRNGEFFVQDVASMLPPHALDVKPGQVILDMCAAPGGKTTHMVQLAGGDVAVIAGDIHANRLRLVDDNAERLGMEEQIIPIALEGEYPPFQRESFDRVLVDAPCSGMGTLRRNPDLKWRMQPEWPADLAETQRDLLRSAIRLCKNGGLIVYSVCTFSRAETDEVVQTILQEGGVVAEDGPDWLAPWRIRQGTYRVLPQEGGWDGFYFTRFRKGF